MIKIKIVDGLYCPTPFCDECGEEIKGADKGDPGAYIFLMPTSKSHEGATLDIAFVHMSHARGCMDRWEKRHRANASDETLRGWDVLKRLAIFAFNNPGFQSGLSEKFRIVKGEIQSDDSMAGS